MSDLILPIDDGKAGVTDFAKRLLVGDPRGRIEREFVLHSKDAVTVRGTILDVWRTYTECDDYVSLDVMYGGEARLIHRKENRIGFTPFAKEHLLYANGHVRDTKNRTYIMSGKSPDEKRIRREIKVTILVAWLDYAAHTEYTHLWVKWKDGRRHLVHRKGL